MAGKCNPADLARGPGLTAAAASMARVPLLRDFAASREVLERDGLTEAIFADENAQL